MWGEGKSLWNMFTKSKLLSLLEEKEWDDHAVGWVLFYKEPEPTLKGQGCAHTTLYVVKDQFQVFLLILPSAFKVHFRYSPKSM